jgi:isoleucyl-tRNA synthetase
MKGYYAPRRAGWDTHGLPVELEVEKELGLRSKPEIEEYGVAEFNARCRQNVLKYVKEWEDLTDRIGFWIDMRSPYITFESGYIETCWWIIKQLWEKGLVYQGYKVTPHCPRCGTSLSSHEVALGYDETDDPSVYIKFRLDDTQPGVAELLGDRQRLVTKPAYFLAWTTTPWTLPGNTALAVAPDAEYVLLEGAGDFLIVASARLKWLDLDEYRVERTIRGSDLVRMNLRYQPLFNPHEYGIERKRFARRGDSGGDYWAPLEPGEKRGDLSYPLINADFVSMDDGTGIVHVAPAFGEVDFEAGQVEGLDFVRDYVEADGVIRGDYRFAGSFVKEADPMILEDLESRGLLHHSETVRHSYPFCWRCSTLLLYYAKPSWYIRTTARKDQLISGNAEINWFPEHIKNGRFGDWLSNNVDWAVSRERYWGTPLPVWRCAACRHDECVGSVEELAAKPGVTGAEGISDLHRPYIDEVTYACPKCAGEMRRVPEVIDCWFDSGAMPFAQWHYPFENCPVFEERFPADYICEAVDQTRGWFYSLHAISTLVEERPCFRNVICLGHILDGSGLKMAKSEGNIVTPEEVLDATGADALRWYLYTSSPPGNPRRFSRELVEEVIRKFLLTLWNTYSFFVTYANIDGFDPGSDDRIGTPSDLDRWVISELNMLVDSVTRSLDDYDPTDAGRKIDEFVRDLSNWYVRRSRRRFWKSENDDDKLAAYSTLYLCLVTLARLLAPFTPFVAEALYQNLVRSVDDNAPESVHLADYPEADLGAVDEELCADTRLVMDVSSMGRSARAQARLKVRQPLARVLVKVRSAREAAGLRRMASQVLEELNVKEVVAVEKLTSEDHPDWPAVEEGGLMVMIDPSITAELADEGLARELVHRLQTMRKKAGFDIADHIETYYQGGDTIRRVVAGYTDYIKQETLSGKLIEGAPGEGAYAKEDVIEGNEVVLAVKRT